MTIANMVGFAYSKERILREIEKCVVICSNCHRKLHWKQRKRRRGVWYRTK